MPIIARILIFHILKFWDKWKIEIWIWNWKSKESNGNDLIWFKKGKLYYHHTSHFWIQRLENINKNIWDHFLFEYLKKFAFHSIWEAASYSIYSRFMRTREFNNSIIPSNVTLQIEQNSSRILYLICPLRWFRRIQEWVINPRLNNIHPGIIPKYNTRIYPTRRTKYSANVAIAERI